MALGGLNLIFGFPSGLISIEISRHREGALNTSKPTSQFIGLRFPCEGPVFISPLHVRSIEEVLGVWVFFEVNFAQSLSLTSPDPKAYRALPRVSIVVSLWGYLIRMLTIKSVQPKKGTAMETIR